MVVCTTYELFDERNFCYTTLKWRILLYEEYNFSIRTILVNLPTMMLQLVEILHSVLYRSVEVFLTALVYLAIAVAVANRVGWLDRWIWFVLEKEGKKILNGARVTIGSFTIEWSDVLQGKITLHASNAIIHTPQRNEWQWDSPLIARIGKATVECNALITVFHGVLLGKEVPVEAYTIIVSDVQVFVERRNSVINVYLLNPTLQLPPPPYSKKKKKKSGDSDNDGTEKEFTKGQNHVSEKEGPKLSAASVKADTDTDTTENRPEDRNDCSLSTTFFDAKSSINPLEKTHPSSDRDNHTQQAKALVNEMLQAVQVLGGAAARGQLPGAIKQQGLELVGRLQGFREQQNLEEGIRVMQQVGKVAVESLQTAPTLIMPQPDTNRESDKKIIYIRIGRIVGNDLRIFTKDSWINPSNTQEDYTDSIGGGVTGVQNTAKETNNDDNQAATDNNSSTDANVNQNGSWNKPIYIEKMVLRSSELCPPMSMKDDDDLPAVFQSIDKIMEVVWRRVLAEIAKSNTGRLFSTAFGEILSVMVTNPHHSIPLLPAAGAASPVVATSKKANLNSMATT